jgi:hypothetical protein
VTRRVPPRRSVVSELSRLMIPTLRRVKSKLRRAQFRRKLRKRRSPYLFRRRRRR